MSTSRCADRQAPKDGPVLRDTLIAAAEAENRFAGRALLGLAARRDAVLERGLEVVLKLIKWAQPDP